MARCFVDRAARPRGMRQRDESSAASYHPFSARRLERRLNHDRRLMVRPRFQRPSRQQRRNLRSASANGRIADAAVGQHGPGNQSRYWKIDDRANQRPRTFCARARDRPIESSRRSGRADSRGYGARADNAPRCDRLCCSRTPGGMERYRPHTPSLPLPPLPSPVIASLSSRPRRNLAPRINSPRLVRLQHHDCGCGHPVAAPQRPNTLWICGLHVDANVRDAKGFC